MRACLDRARWQPVVTEQSDLEAPARSSNQPLLNFLAFCLAAIGVSGLILVYKEETLLAHKPAQKKTPGGMPLPAAPSTIPSPPPSHFSQSSPPSREKLSQLPMSRPANPRPNLTMPSQPSPEVSPPSLPVSLTLHWSIHPRTNCWWGGNGAESELESPQGSAAPEVYSLMDCKTSCMGLYPLCGGVLFQERHHRCYRKGKITLSKCHYDAQLELHLLELPSPPFPPLMPPSPPRPPFGRGVEALNKQFREGQPSDMLEEVGVLMHQWDGQEDREKPWTMCEQHCMCQGTYINGRISTMVIYKDLNKRADRVAVPLPFGNRGGILLHPSYSTVDCLYGIDGGTYRLNNPDHPGCSDTFCDPNAILDHNGNVFCGFNGVPATAWSPRDLKQLLKTHARSGAPWHEPGFHSGYNEIILNSVMHNRNLPHAVAGFFFLRGENPVTDDLGYSIIIDVVEVHQAFLSEYGITAAEVPLVEFDPNNWDAPFSLYVS